MKFEDMINTIKKYHKIAVDRLNGITANGQTSIFTNFNNVNNNLQK